MPGQHPRLVDFEQVSNRKRDANIDQTKNKKVNVIQS